MTVGHFLFHKLNISFIIRIDCYVEIAPTVYTTGAIELDVVEEKQDVNGLPQVKLEEQIEEKPAPKIPVKARPISKKVNFELQISDKTAPWLEFDPAPFQTPAHTPVVKVGK